MICSSLCISFTIAYSAPDPSPYHKYNFEYNPTYLYSIIAVILLALVVILSTRYTKKLLFGAFLFLITLLPTLQFIPNSSVIVADRYTYIPSIGIFFIMATFIYWLYSKKLKMFSLVLVILIISTFSIMTYSRCKVWKDSVTLWNNALINYPGSSIIYSSLGAAYSDLGQDDKAILNFKKAAIN